MIRFFANLLVFLWHLASHTVRGFFVSQRKMPPPIPGETIEQMLNRIMQDAPDFRPIARFIKSPVFGRMFEYLTTNETHVVVWVVPDRRYTLHVFTNRSADKVVGFRVEFMEDLPWYQGAIYILWGIWWMNLAPPTGAWYVNRLSS